MKAVVLSKAYDPKTFEDRIYQRWMEKGLFAPEGEGSDPFTIVMPPPNVTGILHMGHALNNSLQDILTRYHRMKGRPTLWLPGTDHAGIATQNIVEREIAKEGLRRQDLGRERFLERTWLVKDRHHAIIKKQLEKIGSSCDWSRERFTMDEGLSHAVREAFVTLYERDLIYKGEYLVNYCPKCGTALADDEVEYQEVAGTLWNVRYPYSDGSGFITVATTRPETMFGDVAVAVNPTDERYTHLVGTMVSLPLTDREIPIIADSFVEKEFGTGMVKITPAHDPNDYQAGSGTIWSASTSSTVTVRSTRTYRRLPGISAEKARVLVVKDLVDGGFITGEKAHNHEVGHCYRCHTIIEPYLSNQWFVRMQGMAEKALKAHQDGKVISTRDDGRTPTPTGLRTSTTGASAASSGGGTASRYGSARRVESGSSAVRTRPPARHAIQPTSGRRPTCWTPGSAPGSGPSRPSDGPRRPATLPPSSPPARWSPATTSSSSGSAG